jgi:biopolymer transport protein ExbD
MIDRNLNLFSIGFLGVALTVFVFMFAGIPMSCEMGYARLDVPWASSATVLTESTRDLEIRLTADHRILIGPNIVPGRILREQLAGIAARGVDRQVHIHADRKVPFSWVQEILVASRDAGFTEVSLVTFRGTRIDALQKGGAV